VSAETVWFEDKWWPVLADSPPANIDLLLIFNGNWPCTVCGSPSVTSPAARCWSHRKVATVSFFEMVATAS
jgi:hypothetical protein